MNTITIYGIVAIGIITLIIARFYYTTYYLGKYDSYGRGSHSVWLREDEPNVKRYIEYLEKKGIVLGKPYNPDGHYTDFRPEGYTLEYRDEYNKKITLISWLIALLGIMILFIPVILEYFMF